MSKPDFSEIFTDDVKHQLAAKQVDLIVLCLRNGNVKEQPVHGDGEEGVNLDQGEIKAVLIKGQVGTATTCYWCTNTGGKDTCFEVPCK